jgi:sulfite reductase (NADPH) flavoprotein alpha-component
MIIPVLPESAPFSAAQRGWLNGFLAGLLGLAKAGSPPASAPASNAPVEEETFPWHDSTLPMDERLKLAEGKPHERVLMAAMAQLDCGSCGYLCKSYAEAIAAGEETDLGKCSPGGKETLKKLKELNADRKPLPAVAVKSEKPAGGANANSPRFDRKNPFPAPLIQCVNLNGTGSEKDVRFVSFNLKGSGLRYDVGDALGVYPENCPELAEEILEALKGRGDELVTFVDGRFLHSFDALCQEYNITKVGDRLLRLLAASATDPVEEAALRALADDDKDNYLEQADLLDSLRRFPSARPTVLDFVGALAPLQPRLYSISSSLKAHPDEVHLTVGVVKYTHDNRKRKGVCSTYLADRVKPRQKSRVFVHPSHGFRLPANGDTPIIMVGPGTGIAPFRAFLHERRAVGAKGKNWLFFGDQRSRCDFLYRDEITMFLEQGALTRLDTAFSRDQAEKIYVQHRLKSAASKVWSWLRDGAHFYVCGDARRMAADVDAALQEIAVSQGGLSVDNAKDYLKSLRDAGRYQRDVY